MQLRYDKGSRRSPGTQRNHDLIYFDTERVKEKEGRTKGAGKRERDRDRDREREREREREKRRRRRGNRAVLYQKVA